MSENTTSPKQMSFAADFLVNLTVSPGSEEARKMTVTSGRNISALLKNSDPLGLLVKTCLESEQLFSTMCYLTWNLSDTPQSRLIFQLSHSTPPIEGIDTLLLPTPKAATGTYQRSPGSKKKRYTLEGMARHGLFPTPRARDWKGQTQRGVHAPEDGLCNMLNITGGQLNPQWVEWLMGFPIGWTDLEHSETP